MYQKQSLQRYNSYNPVRHSLTTFAVITIILIVLTIINACVCMANFDHGLKPFIAGRKLESDDEKLHGNMMTEMPSLSHHGGMPVSSRMTID